MSSPSRRLAPLFALAACGPLEVREVTATVSEDVVTVVTVEFETTRDVAAHVEFGVDGAFDRSTPVEAEESKVHSIPLVGIPPETEVSYRVVADDVVSEAGTITTGVLPAGVPTATVEGELAGEYLLTSVNGPTNWVVMYDPSGAVVWYYADKRGLSLFRALVSGDGSGIVFASAIQGGGPAETSAFVRVPWSGSGVEEIPVPALAHDFVELDDGSIVTLAYHEQDGEEGNSLLRVAADGATEELWTTFDCYDPDEDLGDDPSQGWTHANAMDALADGTYLVGLRNFGTITRVDPSDRSCTWGFGGPNGTVTLDGGRFIHQHQFEWTGDTMYVFDNDGLAGEESRVAVYPFDGTQTSAALSRSVRADPPEYSFIMGDVHPLSEDRVLLTWSVPRKIDVYAADDTRLGRWTLSGAGPMGFVDLLSTPYGGGD